MTFLTFFYKAMESGMERVRGGKRKKIENLIIEAGYYKEYADNPYNKNLRIENRPKKIYIAKLAEAMKKEKTSFTASFRSPSGLSKKLATEILDHLKKNHNIKPTFRL